MMALKMWYLSIIAAVIALSFSNSTRAAAPLVPTPPTQGVCGPLVPGCGPLVPTVLSGINIIHVASNSGVGVATVVVTVPASGVPAGSALGVVASDSSNIAGSLADTAGDGFVLVSQQGPASAVTVVVAISTNGSALGAGNTITYTLGQAGHNATVEAFYLTGAALSLGNNIIDVASGGLGASAMPSVVSSVPVTSGEMFIAVVASASAVMSFTQDAADAVWVTPPGQVSIAAPMLVGGSFFNPNAAALTYAPTLGASVAWAELIVGVRSR